ncbi:MAG: carboxypeptidase, partial [Solirubrobacteraceae bacterium]
DVLYPPPCAYDITAAEAARMQGMFALHGIVTEPRGGDVRVSPAQPAQPRIPLLLDADARFSPVDGRRVEGCG